MSERKKTFSRQVKDELSHVACDRACCQRAELAAAFFGAGQIVDGALLLSTAHSAGASRLSTLFQQRYGSAPEWQAGRELVSLTIRQPDALQAVFKDLSQLFGFDPSSGGSGILNCTSDCCRQAILRALFLAGGSISEPATAYHLELSLRRPEAARMAIGLLAELSIRAGNVSRHGHNVVYIKEGQFISDFLLLTGAHLSLLDFESLRVEKEMRNSVNRMVNCDSANIQRIADTAARQLELIREMTEQGWLSLLPADLQVTAETRLENPDLSIKELGEMMQPPLGKSGMNHRLKRLEQAAAELLAGKGVRSHGT